MSVEDETALGTRARVMTDDAAMVGMTVPLLVGGMDTWKVVPLLGAISVMVAAATVAVPVLMMSAGVKVAALIGRLKTTVNRTGEMLVGSVWAMAWLMVTVLAATTLRLASVVFPDWLPAMSWV